MNNKFKLFLTIFSFFSLSRITNASTPINTADIHNKKQFQIILSYEQVQTLLRNRFLTKENLIEQPLKNSEPTVFDSNEVFEITTESKDFAGNW